MRLIDEQYLRHPEYGSPRMTDLLNAQGYLVNHKRVERLMKLMGIAAITPGPHTSKPNTAHPVYPYLLEQVDIERKNQIWSADITYIPMQRGFLYLVAVIDWWSRYVLAWEISNSMDISFCVAALSKALRLGRLYPNKSTKSSTVFFVMFWYKCILYRFRPPEFRGVLCCRFQGENSKRILELFF